MCLQNVNKPLLSILKLASTSKMTTPKAHPGLVTSSGAHTPGRVLVTSTSELASFAKLFRENVGDTTVSGKLSDTVNTPQTFRRRRKREQPQTKLLEADPTQIEKDATVEKGQQHNVTSGSESPVGPGRPQVVNSNIHCNIFYAQESPHKTRIVPPICRNTDGTHKKDNQQQLGTEQHS